MCGEYRTTHRSVNDECFIEMLTPTRHQIRSGERIRGAEEEEEMYTKGCWVSREDELVLRDVKVNGFAHQESARLIEGHPCSLVSDRATSLEATRGQWQSVAQSNVVSECISPQVVSSDVLC